MVEIVKVDKSKIDLRFKKNIDDVTIKLNTTNNDETFYITNFDNVVTDVIYWVSHPRLYIEKKVYVEIYSNNELINTEVIDENTLTKEPNHVLNVIPNISDSNIKKINDSFYEIFIHDSFGINENCPQCVENVNNFIDLGGNCGFFSRYIFNRNPKAKGVIVEPNSNLSEVIGEINSSYNFVLKQAAFNSVCDGKVYFNISKSYLDTAVTHEADLDIGFTPNGEFQKTEVETCNIKSLLDEFNNGELIDILKVDIEGGEQHLNGEENQKLIKERVKYILIETHSKEIENTIRNNFYNVFDIMYGFRGDNFSHMILKNKNLVKKRILVKVPSPAMGDTLCSTPTIRKISESYGQKVDVMAVRDDVLMGSPYIDNLLKFKNEVNGYDEVFDTFVRSIKVNKNMDSKTFYDNPMEIKLSNFEARQIHALSVGITLYPEELSCDFYPDEQTERSVLIDKNCIVLHVTDSWPNRTWSTQKWQRLIDLIKENTNLRVVTIGMSHSEHGHFGTIEKKVVKLNNVDFDYCIDEEIKDQVFQNSRHSLSEMWHILNNSYGLISFDSGPIHLAGTTDSWIFQIGASIRPEKTAPWRNESQKYKFEFIGGECKIMCGSCPKYSVKEWGTINSMPYYPECQEGYDEFKCQPSPDEVFFKVVEKYNNV